MSLIANGETAGVMNHTYDANNRLISMAIEADEGTVTYPFTYDNNGNMLTRLLPDESTVTYTYNALNQQAGATSNGINSTYTYNASGIRTGKTVGNTRTDFLLDGENVVGEVQNNAVTTSYLWGINPISVEENGDTEFYLYNAHGDVTECRDNAGTLTREYFYTAFGWEIIGSPTNAGSIRYSGEYWDEETQTYYLRARYYDPVYGRFTQQDPVPYVSRDLPGGTSVIDSRSLNLYTYCANNPVVYHDPSGNAWETVLDFVSLGSSILTFQSDPSLLNAAYLLWDIGGLAVPILPGSYVAKGARLAGATDDVTDGLKLIKQIDNYVDIAAAVTKRPDSKMLRIALKSAGETAPDFYAAHHIVAGGAKGAVQARMTLAKYGIDINDAANGVFLPMTKGGKEAYHNTLHTNVYYDAVNELLSKATDSKQARDILESIAEQLRNNTFPH